MQDATTTALDPQRTIDLASLLDAARSAARSQRIAFRDPIAAHGEEAILGVRPWLADPVLAAFAVRVIERAGASGHVDLAVRVLRAARRKAPPLVADDVAWALGRLRVASRPERPEVAGAAAPSPARLLRREPPRLSALAPRRAR
jgi:hypothetical protein